MKRSDENMVIIETCPECGHELTSLCLASYPPQYCKECFNCGWKNKIKQERIIYQPYKEEEND